MAVSSNRGVSFLWVSLQLESYYLGSTLGPLIFANSQIEMTVDFVSFLGLPRAGRKAKDPSTEYPLAMRKAFAYGFGASPTLGNLGAARLVDLCLHLVTWPSYSL